MLAFFELLWYHIEVAKRATKNIRVWRSLVSRLNGVQEASSSNLDTRTMKTERAFALSVFIISRRDSNYQLQLSGGQLLADSLTAATH